MLGVTPLTADPEEQIELSTKGPARAAVAWDSLECCLRRVFTLILVRPPELSKDETSILSDVKKKLTYCLLEETAGLRESMWEVYSSEFFKCIIHCFLVYTQIIVYNKWWQLNKATNSRTFWWPQKKPLTNFFLYLKCTFFQNFQI